MYNLQAALGLSLQCSLQGASNAVIGEHGLEVYASREKMCHRMGRGEESGVRTTEKY